MGRDRTLIDLLDAKKSFLDLKENSVSVVAGHYPSTKVEKADEGLIYWAMLASTLQIVQPACMSWSILLSPAVSHVLGGARCARSTLAKTAGTVAALAMVAAKPTETGRFHAKRKPHCRVACDTADERCTLQSASQRPHHRRRSWCCCEVAVYYRKLVLFDRQQLSDHYCRLSDEDRCLRFFSGVSDAFLERYAQDMLTFRRRALGCFIDGTLRAVGEVILDGSLASPRAEIALSVEGSHRQEGIGSHLLDSLVTMARNRGVRDIRVACLRENYQMRRLIEKFEGRGVSAGGVFSAHIEAAWPDPWSSWKEASGDVEGAYAAFVERLSA